MDKMSKLQVKNSDISLTMNKKENDEILSFENNIKSQSQKFTPIPKKITLMCIFLMVIGVVFIITGLVDYYHGDKSRGIAFLVFGALTSIPGFYYTYQLITACRASSPEERQEILDDIPYDKD